MNNPATTKTITLHSPATTEAIANLLATGEHGTPVAIGLSTWIFGDTLAGFSPNSGNPLFFKLAGLSAYEDASLDPNQVTLVYGANV